MNQIIEERNKRIKRYIETCREKIKNAKSDEEMDKIIMTIYEEGIEQGSESCEDRSVEPFPWEDLD